MNKKELFDTCNIITPENLEKLIKIQLNAIWDHPDKVDQISPILCHGSPGCGKSSIVKSVCKELGIEFIDVRLSQLEPCDIRGLPVPNKEDRVMEWFVNGTWPRDPKGRGIIFLDEITAADRSIQVAAYELVLDRRLGNLYKVPDGYYIMAAGNTASDRAVATTMSSALANRFLHVELRPDQENWIKWARFNDIHPSVIGFISYKAEALFNMEDQNLERGWPSPRSWERVSQTCYICNADKVLLRTAVNGLIGTGYGAEFMTFYELNSSFEDVLEMMTNQQKEIVIPKEADKIFSLCSTMVYLLWRGKDKEDEQNRLTGFFRICLELSSDFASMAFFAAMQGNDKNNNEYYCDALLGHPMFKQWKDKHKDALFKHMKQNNLSFSRKNK